MDFVQVADVLKVHQSSLTLPTANSEENVEDSWRKMWKIIGAGDKSGC